MQPLASDDPATIGPYTLIGVLGEGGMGKVYIARTEAGKPIAVKVIRTHDGSPAFRERFAREVNLAIKVRGLYTADVIAADPHAQRPWMAVEYVPGISLAQAMEASGPLYRTSVRILAAGLVEALQAVHGAGILHRDLKPGNVLLTLDQGPRVIDFGIAKAIDPQEVTGHTPLTATGYAPGTPGYMAPEQLRGEELTHKSDIFTLGGVLYFAATARNPFGEGSTPALSHRILAEEPDVEALTCYRALILQCLDKDPDNRPTLDQIQARIGSLGITENASLLPAAARRKVEAERRELHSLDRAAGNAATQPPGPTRPLHSEGGPPSAPAPGRPPKGRQEDEAEGADAERQPLKTQGDAPDQDGTPSGRRRYRPVLRSLWLRVLVIAVLAYIVIGWTALGVTTWAGTRFPAAAELDIPSLLSLAAVPYSFQLGLILVHFGAAIAVGVSTVKRFSEAGFDGVLFGLALALIVIAGLTLIILDALGFPTAVWILDGLT